MCPGGASVSTESLGGRLGTHLAACQKPLKRKEVHFSFSFCKLLSVISEHEGFVCPSSTSQTYEPQFNASRV